jgi:polyhydroxyalkanoate synthase
MDLKDVIEDNKKMITALEVFLKAPEFEVGTTPSDMVYQEDDMRLLHYRPTVKRPFSTPVLMVYALVNRYYIVDLQPDKSMVRRFLEEGLDVYIIDWGYPSGADRYLTIDDYVNGYMDTAIDKVRTLSGANKITLFGICQGGTFSVMYTALHPEKIMNLVTMVTPVDFDTDKGLLHVWSKALDADKIVDAYGIVPGDLLNVGFLLTDPFRLLIDKYVGLFEKLECDENDEDSERHNEETIKNFLRMEKWIFDSPDQAGEAYREFIKDLYQKNLLIKNKMSLDGKKIDLKKITMPLLNVMGEFDHLVPNDASKPLMKAVSSKDKEMMVFPTGHIGMFVSGKSQREICPKISAWLVARSADTGTGQTRRQKSKRKPKRRSTR